MVLGQLFVAFLRVGLLSIGGGYVLIPLIEQEVVRVYGWLTREEFLQVLGVTQGIPGAISMKFATYTGYRIAGYPGVVAANLGILLPPVILMLILGTILLRYGHHRYFTTFLRGVQFATIGLLLSVTINLARGQSWGVAGGVFTALSVVLLTVTNVHPALVIFAAGFLGIFIMR